MVNVLEVDGVHFGFNPERLLLADIYLKVKTGEVVGLLGRNGSGKSTLLKLIFGSQEATHKSIRINGEFLAQPYKKAGTVAYLPQKGYLPKNEKVQSLISLFIPEKSEQQKVQSDTRIQSLLKLRVNELSGGQLRYLEVRLLLALQTRFLLLDEPFSGVEPLYKSILINLLKEASATTGILLTDHSYEQVLEVSDKLYLLREAAIKPISSKNDLVDLGYLPYTFAD